MEQRSQFVGLHCTNSTARAGQKQSVEVDGGVTGVLGIALHAVSAGKRTEEGVGQETCHLLLREGDGVILLFL